MKADRHEVQGIKDALRRNPRNLGVGILHEPTGRIYLAPFDDVPGGHADLAAQRQLPPGECKGFGVLRRSDDTLVPVNNSHLNGPQGQPGSLRMPPATFAGIVQALKDAGL